MAGVVLEVAVDELVATQEEEATAEAQADAAPPQLHAAQR